MSQKIQQFAFPFPEKENCGWIPCGKYVHTIISCETGYFYKETLKDELTEIGQYDQGSLDKKAHAVWAGDQIVTSRGDPFSSELMGEELVNALKKGK